MLAHLCNGVPIMNLFFCCWCVSLQPPTVCVRACVCARARASPQDRGVLTGMWVYLMSVCVSCLSQEDEQRRAEDERRRAAAAAVAAAHEAQVRNDANDNGTLLLMAAAGFQLPQCSLMARMN